MSSSNVSLFRIHTQSGLATLLATTLSVVKDQGAANGPAERCTIVAVEAVAEENLTAGLAFLDGLTTTNPDVYITVHGVDAPTSAVHDSFWVSQAAPPPVGGRNAAAVLKLQYTWVGEDVPGATPSLSMRCHAFAPCSSECHLPMLLHHHFGLLRPYDTQLNSLCDGAVGGPADFQSCIQRLRWC